MEKVIIDIGLLKEWSTANSCGNSESILGFLKENNFQPYIFDFQAKCFELKILKTQLKGIRIKIIEKEMYANSESVAVIYEEKFKVKLTDLEKNSLLSYLGCGFSGIKYFLRKNDLPIKESGYLGKLDNFHKFNLELVKV